jgi:hypothetical protein
MVRNGRALASALALAAVLAGSTCKVVNEDHCANQEVPGNEFCRELNTATPYCSPCRREFHGCVDYEPYACGGYDNEIGQDDGDGPSESTTTDEPESTGPTPGSTTDASESSGGASTAGSSG